MAGNVNFDALSSTTLNNYRKTIQENVFNAIPLMVWLMKKNRKVTLDGGVKIIVPVLYEKNTTVKSYSGYEPLDVTPQEGISAAEYEWKQIAGSITISRAEERKNSGESRIINLLSTKIEQCQMSLSDVIGEMLFSDGTGNEGKDVLGLQAIIANDPTSGIVGGINRATEPWWRNQSVVGTDGGTPFDNLRKKMTNMYNTCNKAKGVGMIDLIMCDQLTFEGYESTLVGQKRFSRESDADAGFENLKFKGAIVGWDDKCPATSALGNMYFLNSKFIQWTVDAETDFTTTPFVRPENQDAKTAQILVMAQLCTSNPRSMGVIYDISLT